MPYSSEAYAMAVAAEISRLESQTRNATGLMRRIQASIDAGMMPNRHDSMRANIQELMEWIQDCQVFKTRRALQLASLVSPFPWPIHVEALGRDDCTLIGGMDPVLREYDMYTGV
jgi:hypothetical protein